MLRFRYYVGCRHNGEYEIFRSVDTPLYVTHGKDYVLVIGPFRTKRGAVFMAEHGRGNPHLQTVADAERYAKAEAR